MQVDGKVRQVITVAADADLSEVEAQALVLSKIRQAVNGREIIKKLYVPGKIFSIVTKH